MSSYYSALETTPSPLRNSGGRWSPYSPWRDDCVGRISTRYPLNAQGPMLPMLPPDCSGLERPLGPRFLGETEPTPPFSFDLPSQASPRAAFSHSWPGASPPLLPFNHRPMSPNPSSVEPSDAGSETRGNSPETPPSFALMRSPFVPPYMDDSSSVIDLDFLPASTHHAEETCIDPHEIGRGLHLGGCDPGKGNADFDFGDKRDIGSDCCPSHCSFDGSQTIMVALRDSLSSDEPDHLAIDSPLSSPSHSLHKLECGPMGEGNASPVAATNTKPRKRKSRDIDDDDDDDEYVPNHKKAKSPVSARTRKSQQKKRPTGQRSGSGVGKAKSAPAKAMTPAPPAAGATGSKHSCPHCKNPSFRDEASLKSHIKKQHTRPFFCVFRFAGCESTFATKNEWKRHVTTQHLLLNYWVCTEGDCAKSLKSSGTPTQPTSSRRKARGSSTPRRSSSLESSVFNRKDLHKQHIIRMHMPADMKNRYQEQQRQKQPGRQRRLRSGRSEGDDFLLQCHTKSVRDRCSMPSYMRCPSCGKEFRGPDSWDQRMEHSAKHLEKASNNKEAPFVFGGPEDKTLLDWASSPEVAVLLREAGGWKLNKSLKYVRRDSSSMASPSACDASTVVVSTSLPASEEEGIATGDSSEEDAEGEECDDD